MKKSWLFIAGVLFATCAFAGEALPAEAADWPAKLGMTPKIDEAPPVDWKHVKPEAFVYDIIYTPERTRFLREAEARGHRVLNGTAMLVGQGAEAFAMWTGIRPDEAVMEKALLESLRAKEQETES